MEIKDLTDQEKQTMYEVKDEWEKRIYREKPFDKDAIIEGINWLYKYCGFNQPRIVFVESPLAAQYASNLLIKDITISDEKLLKEVDKMLKKDAKYDYQSFSYYGNITDVRWVAFYDFFTRIGKIQNEDFNKYQKLVSAGIFDSIQFDEFCVICKYPLNIYRDPNNNLHCEDRPALEWADGFKLYFLQGIKLEKEMWENITQRKYSFEDIMKIENIEHRMLALRYMDPNIFLEKSNAKLVDMKESEYEAPVYSEPKISDSFKKISQEQLEEFKNKNVDIYDEPEIIRHETRTRRNELYRVENLFRRTAYFLKYNDTSNPDRTYISGIDPEFAEKNPDADACMAWKGQATFKEYALLRKEA